MTKVYKIPSDEYTSYLAVDPQSVTLYHSGNVRVMEGTRESLLGGSELITTKNGLKFIIPSDMINYSFPPSLLNEATVVVKEFNPKIVTVVLQAVKANDPNALKFIPSDTFRGSKPGYVFTTREGRTGYYLDQQELAKQAGQTFENLKPKFSCDAETGVCSISPVEKAGRMFHSPPQEQEPSGWSATGEPIYAQPETNDFAGREAVLYRHQLAQNERAVGPDSLPMHFQ